MHTLLHDHFSISSFPHYAPLHSPSGPSFRPIFTFPLGPPSSPPSFRDMPVHLPGMLYFSYCSPFFPYYYFIFPFQPQCSTFNPLVHSMLVHFSSFTSSHLYICTLFDINRLLPTPIMHHTPRAPNCSPISCTRLP